MNRDSFQTYLLDHLWKVGDQVVIDNLQTIYLTAESELNRDLVVEDRYSVVDIQATSNSVPLPDDYLLPRALTSLKLGKMDYYPPSTFSSRLATGHSFDRDYTTVHETLRVLSNPSVEVPAEYEFWYYNKILGIGFAHQEDTFWVVDRFFDVYLYTVLKHTAPFLREDSRLQTWGALHSDAMRSVTDFDIQRKFAGSPIKISLNRNVR